MSGRSFRERYLPLTRPASDDAAASTPDVLVEAPRGNGQARGVATGMSGADDAESPGASGAGRVSGW